MGHTACTEPQCLYKGDLYPFFSSLVIKLLKTVAPMPLRSGSTSLPERSGIGATVLSNFMTRDEAHVTAADVTHVQPLP